MSKVPRSILKQTRMRKHYVNGLSVGGTTLTGAALTNIASVAEMDESDLAAIEDAAELAAVIGTYAGDEDLSTDVAALETSVDTAETGLLDRTTALEYLDYLSYAEDVEVGTTYTYDGTPSEDVSDAIVAGKTCAVITPGGSTNWNLTFTLPSTNTSDTNVFKVSYDLGTHAGTVIVGGETLSGSGILHFFWTGAAWATWDTNALSITLPDRSRGIFVALEDGGVANAITVILPVGASNVGKTILLGVSLTADSDAACTLNITGNIFSSSGLSENVTDVENGMYALHCGSAGLWIPVKSLAIGTNA